MLFRKFAALLSNRQTPAPKRAPELESVPALRAHLRAKGLSAEEARGIIVDRTLTAWHYWEARGYSKPQIDDMPVSQWLAIPTGKREQERYYACRRSMMEAERFAGWFIPQQHYRAG
jgi:hypothetical protein